MLTAYGLGVERARLWQRVVLPPNRRGDVVLDREIGVATLDVECADAFRWRDGLDVLLLGASEKVHRTGRGEHDPDRENE